MMEILRIVSLVLLWCSIGLNLYAAYINYRGYKRNKELSERYRKALEGLTNFGE